MKIQLWTLAIYSENFLLAGLREKPAALAKSFARIISVTSPRLLHLPKETPKQWQALFFISSLRQSSATQH